MKVNDWLEMTGHKFKRGRGRGEDETYDEQHEVFQHALEMAVAWDGNGAVDNRADESPDETGNGLGPRSHELQAECQAVDVWAIVGDDTESEDDKAEFAKGAERWEKYCGEKATNSSILISVFVGHVDGVERCGCDGQPKHFRESEGNDESPPSPGESLDPGYIHRLVDGVIGRVASPARAKAVDGSRERQDAACL